MAGHFGIALTSTFMRINQQNILKIEIAKEEIAYREQKKKEEEEGRRGKA